MKARPEVDDNTPPARPNTPARPNVDDDTPPASQAHPERRQRRVSYLQGAEVHHAARRDCSSHTDRLHDPSQQPSGIHHHTCESGVVTTPRHSATSPLLGHQDSFLRTALSLSLLLWFVRSTSNNLGVECSARYDSSEYSTCPSDRYISRQRGTPIDSDNRWLPSVPYPFCGSVYL